MITAFTSATAPTSRVGMFTHDEWPRGVEIKGGKTVDIVGFSDSKLNGKFQVLSVPPPTPTTFYVETSAPANTIEKCAVCSSNHNGYKPACIHYGSDGKTAPNEWVESAMGNSCSATSTGSPTYGVGHESVEACKATCNSVLACVAFTWHNVVKTYFGRSWDGGCEYVCNGNTASGICKSKTHTDGYGSKGTVPSNIYCSARTVSNNGKQEKCYSKPCARDTISAKDCSWFCQAGGAWGAKHTSDSQTGCSHYTTQPACSATAAIKTDCRWITSASDSINGNRCTDRHDKPMRITDALSFTSPLAPLSTCSTRQSKTSCPVDQLCSAGAIGDRLETTPTKVRVVEAVISDGGKTANIKCELLRGSARPVFVANDKVDVVGFGNDVDGRWKIKTTPVDFLDSILLSRIKIASVPSVNSVMCPPTGPGCEMRLVDDRGQLPICTDGNSNEVRSHRYIRESEQAITLKSEGLLMNVRDYKCNALGSCDWNTAQIPPGYPAGQNGEILASNKITIKKQRCSPGFGEDRKDYNSGNPLFKVFDNISPSTDKEEWSNWIGTTDFALATLHGYFTAPNPQSTQISTRGIHTYCTKWDLEIEIAGYGQGSTKQECALSVEVINLNDSPQFIAKQMSTRIFPEKSAPGTVIELKDNNGALGDPIGGLGSEDSDAPGGKGQNNFFFLRQGMF